ncbi:hypothetical protein DFR24_3431 [Panacagrimonas perspica]|uniref:Uncharacterized protein n=1 Tax=Panacagrimonas perspica TaxID=381431 RepID=A0A4R7NYT6_9GAMM|nr:hypothetical protein [Panacagrimonas perspica]TDU26407.1 hypothetical protein DFR24_3431 [Panacagrimonas perspica]THD02041.1 hypothetical protein B1810_16230 [Panacagrimonas perspica]
MPVLRCQDCEIPISLYCRKCPNCCARNPAFRRRSPVAMFVLLLLMALAVVIVKNVKSDDGAAPAAAEWGSSMRPSGDASPSG